VSRRNLDPGKNPIAPISVTIGDDGNERQNITVQGKTSTVDTALDEVTVSPLPGSKVGQDVAAFLYDANGDPIYQAADGVSGKGGKLLCIGGFDPSFDAWGPLPLTSDGQAVNIAGTVSAFCTNGSFTQANALIVGGSLTVAVSSYGNSLFAVTGTFTNAELFFEYNDGAAWWPLLVYPVGQSSPVSTITVSTASQFSFVAGPTFQVRMRLNSLGSGSLVGRVLSSAAAPLLQPVVSSFPSIAWGAVTRTTVGTTGANAAAANLARRAITLYCEAGGQLYWTFNGTASATNYQGILNAGQGLEWSEARNSTQALSVRGSTASVTYTVCEAT
jgi:hypothetical protein